MNKKYQQEIIKHTPQNINHKLLKIKCKALNINHQIKNLTPRTKDIA